MGFRSVNAAEQHLRALEKKGAIDISSGASRGIRVLDGRPAGRRASCSSCRWSAASPPAARCSPRSTCRARYQVDPNLFTPRADYLLRVRGLSMRDAGILEGDLLAVHARRKRAPGRSSSPGLPTKSQ